MDTKLLEAVRNYADAAHGSQRRKYSPDRYIVHPIRVMETCSAFTQDPAILSAALLHDVLEDTKFTRQQLQDFLMTIMDEGNASRTLRFVIELTDIYTKENYPHYNRRKRKRKEADRIEKTSAESQTIKYADIIDNVPEITEHDPDFANTFLHECKQLLSRMKKGNQELYQRAVDVVTENLSKLKESVNGK